MFVLGWDKLRLFCLLVLVVFVIRTRLFSTPFNFFHFTILLLAFFTTFCSSYSKLLEATMEDIAKRFIYTWPGNPYLDKSVGANTQWPAWKTQNEETLFRKKVYSWDRDQKNRKQHLPPGLAKEKHLKNTQGTGWANTPHISNTDNSRASGSSET